MRDRRSFLSGLASLPLIGGGVALIGRPTAAAVPITTELVDCYNEWLYMEHRLLCVERYGYDGRGGERYIPSGTAAFDFHFPAGCPDWRKLPQPSTRAAVVLSAAGVAIGGAA